MGAVIGGVLLQLSTHCEVGFPPVPDASSLLQKLFKHETSFNMKQHKSFWNLF
jgi:hypothetical protein